MITPCPHCQTEIEIDPATLAALQGQENFACPACEGLVAVPVSRTPVKVTAAAIRPVEPAVKASVSAGSSAFKGLNRNLLILGCAVLLVLGGIGFFLASQKTGDTNIVNSTSYQEIQNNYFSQIIVDGTTTKEDLAMIQDIKPYGTLFIGISRNTLTLEEAKDLAKRTGSTILDYTTDQPNKPAPLSQWITSAFSVEEKAWVSLHSQHQVIDGNAQLFTAGAEAEHRALLAWQGPKELMMKAVVEKSGEKMESKKPAADIISHPLNGIFSSPMGNGSGRYAFNVFPDGHVSGLYFDGNPVSNAAFTGTITNDVATITFPNPYVKNVLMILDISSREDGNFTVLQHDKTDGKTSGRITFVITRLGLKGVEEAISAAENGPLSEESLIILDRCRELARNESQSNGGLTTDIEPKRRYFQLDSRPNTYLVNFEPGKWREMDNGRPVYDYAEKSRNDEVIEIHDGSRNFTMRLYANFIELRTPFNNAFEIWHEGRWTESIPGVFDGVQIGIPDDALEFNDHFYKFFPSKKTWEEAQAECALRGGSLAAAESLPEFHQLSLLAGSNHVWVGANNKADGMRWKWTSGAEIPRDLWAWQSPSNPGHAHYVLLYKGFLQSGGISHGYVTGYITEWDEEASRTLNKLPVAAAAHSQPKINIPSDAVAFQGSRYVIYESHENWYTALENCKKLGGSLVNVQNQSELDFLTNEIERRGLTSTQIWLGASNLHAGDEWRWSDGPAFTLKTQIEKDEPLRYLVLQNGKLMAVRNQSHYGKVYICEWQGVGNQADPDNTADGPNSEEQAKPEIRTLTDIQGRTIEVEILSATDAEVSVKLRSSGKMASIRMETLRQQDRKAIQAWRDARPARTSP